MLTCECGCEEMEQVTKVDWYGEYTGALVDYGEPEIRTVAFPMTYYYCSMCGTLVDVDC